MDVDYIHYAREHLQKIEVEIMEAQKWLVKTGVEHDHYAFKDLKRILRGTRNLSDGLLFLEQFVKNHPQ